MFIIPTFTDPYYDQTVTLDGRPYLLTFRYNQREDRWYMDVADVDSNADIANGIKIVVGVDLLAKWRYLANCPAGVLVCNNNSQTDDSAPGLSELGPGLRCELMYITLADAQTLAATGTLP